MMNYVYRYMVGDKWIYVGKASAEKTRDELTRRIRDHKKDKRFTKYADAKVEYCMFNHKSDMNITETMLIKIHRPIINRINITDECIPFQYDESKIKWFDIADFVRHRRSLEEEIQAEKIKEMIQRKSIIADKKCFWFNFEHYFPDHLGVRKFAEYIYNCADKWFRNNKEEFYPECEFTFQMTLKELMFELDYQTIMTASGFSRKLKETIKESFPSSCGYSIDVKHDKDVFTIHVSHFSRMWRDAANTILKLGDVKQ